MKAFQAVTLEVMADILDQCQVKAMCRCFSILNCFEEHLSARCMAKLCQGISMQRSLPDAEERLKALLPQALTNRDKTERPRSIGLFRKSHQQFLWRDHFKSFFK